MTGLFLVLSILVLAHAAKGSSGSLRDPERKRLACHPADALEVTVGDDFDAKKLDTNTWMVLEGCSKKMCRRPDKVQLRDGNLELHMGPSKPYKAADGRVFSYEGGGILMNETLHFGYYEARVAFSGAPGYVQVFWTTTSPSFLEPVDGPQQEFDVVQYPGNRSYYEITTWRWSPEPYAIVGKSRILLQQPTRLSAKASEGCPLMTPALSKSFTKEKLEELGDNKWEGEPEPMKPPSNETDAEDAQAAQLDMTGWHTYGLLYTPEQAFFYLDGVPIRMIDLAKALPGDELARQHVLLTTQVTGETVGEVGDASGVMYVDYFRFHQLPGSETQ
ncbi:unnamed protein product [Vitrella brassicaformis CCMP3155]|uniref:GH16 domain-containing protein n=2 Tax=Vitrella brassicaformis TaxID=1169539 RepID=A0A0G4GIE1_VITBC|nr:unnamed protein product [Vitrella brassicaformis CCMP3155]|eukprot:CEM29347.1 unnamed protein product [Vitrella brassicaformis CCMP3155]